MLYTLKPHPDWPYAAVTGVTVEPVRDGRKLELRYTVTGDTAKMLLPPLGAMQRKDELWRSTCLEAFVMPEGGKSYYELNFAPSGAWAIYQFDDYRTGMQNPDVLTPSVVTDTQPNQYTMRATVELPSEAHWRANLTVVIEEADGKKSFWALAHNPGKPDFHHTDCFLCNLE